MLQSGALFRQLLGRLAVLVIVPSSVYLAVFYAHLHILNHAGPHDTIMTSAFQASLEVGCSDYACDHVFDIINIGISKALCSCDFCFGRED